MTPPNSLTCQHVTQQTTKRLAGKEQAEKPPQHSQAITRCFKDVTVLKPSPAFMPAEST